jgi:3',5'-cyclic AMP phosphodiesterase CpdA
MLTLLHTSDLQCGRPFRPEAAEALVRFAYELRPDVIVVAGDLTQRAKVREFRIARALIERLPPVPVLVTPGNHDVPLYRIWERALAPYRNWKACISPDVDVTVRHPGASFVVLNSSSPHTAIVNGRLRVWQLELAQRTFAAAPVDDVRVLIVHHHFVPAPDASAGPPLPGAPGLVDAFEAMGVDLVLGGHVHETHVSTSRALLPGRAGPGVPLVACGTTTSRRGRGAEKGVNSLNVVRVGPQDVLVVPHKLVPGAAEFSAAEPISIPRHRAGARADTAAD